MARTRVNTTVLVPESPKVAKTLLFTRFRSRHDLRFFEKRVNTSVFFAFIKAKNRFKKGRKCCNLQGFGAATGKKLRKHQRCGVQKWPKHRYIPCFVPSTFSWNCKNRVNTSVFCDQPAKNVVIYSVFFALLSKTLVFAVFCASLVENVLVFTAFSAFLHSSRKRRQNAKMQFTAFCDFRKAKNRPKNVSKRRFFPILGTLQTGEGNALGDAYERPGFQPKSFPPPSWRILGVFRGPASEGRRLGARLTIEL